MFRRSVIDGLSGILFACVQTAAIVAQAELPAEFVAGELIELNDNGAYSWFMDERAIVDRGRLIVGSVRAVKDFRSGREEPHWGNVEIAVLDIESSATDQILLHPHFEQDDHDAPALLVLPDGRYLAVYTLHGMDRRVFSRLSEPGDPLSWGPASVFQSPGEDSPPFSGDNVTYANLFSLPDGRIVNFYRGFRHDPNYMFSGDGGRSWTHGGRMLRGRGGYSPYLKYAHDGRGTIHFIATEDHPRNYDNSIYHGYLREGTVYHSDGTPLGPLSTSTATELTAWDLTRVFEGDADNVGWVIDLELDRDERPYMVFSTQRDGRGLPRMQGGFDHRYHYARWDGHRWHEHEIAYAGTRLYPGEDDYTGLAALDPNNPGVIYISTDADPETGQPLVSTADGRRHHELFRGTTDDGGATWHWQPITANSTVDNLRPIVPKWDDERTALVWLRGRYRHNRGEWTTAVVALVRSHD